MFGKVFEKLIYDSVYRHLCNNDILTPHQFGFRPGDSTVNQLLAVAHKIYSAFEATPTEETRAVFLDLSKALDRVGMKCYYKALNVMGYQVVFFPSLQASLQIENKE